VSKLKPPLDKSRWAAIRNSSHIEARRVTWRLSIVRAVDAPQITIIAAHKKTKANRLSGKEMSRSINMVPEMPAVSSATVMCHT
jgi:hypothetical protein